MDTKQSSQNGKSDAFTLTQAQIYQYAKQGYLPALQTLLAQERATRKVNIADAISTAIREAVEKRDAEKAQHICETVGV